MKHRLSSIASPSLVLNMLHRYAEEEIPVLPLQKLEGGRCISSNFEVVNSSNLKGCH